MAIPPVIVVALLIVNHWAMTAVAVAAAATATAATAATAAIVAVTLQPLGAARDQGLWPANSVVALLLQGPPPVGVWVAVVVVVVVADVVEVEEVADVVGVVGQPPTPWGWWLPLDQAPWLDAPLWLAPARAAPLPLPLPLCLLPIA